MWKWFKIPKKVKRAEELDPTPLDIPLKFRKEVSLEERVKQLVRSEQWAELMRARGQETFEEFNDFEVDDEEPSSVHEIEGEHYEREFDRFAKGHFEKQARMAKKSPPDKAAKTSVPAEPDAKAEAARTVPAT